MCFRTYPSVDFKHLSATNNYHTATIKAKRTYIEIFRFRSNTVKSMMSYFIISLLSLLSIQSYLSK